VVAGPGYLVVSGGRAGTRVLILSPTPAPEVVEVARSAEKVVVEDAYNVVDMASVGLRPRQLPVMIRDRGPALPPPTMPVRRVRADQLALVEDTIVHGFELENFQPYRAGEAFPPALLTREEAALHVIDRDGDPAGACLTITEHGVTGIYWVTTAPEHRSRGVGRQLMHAILAAAGEQPVTLTAASAGRPLYDSLDFEVIGPSTWWI
jgi:GNAT superfamily N-acetyltransferase